MPARLSYFLLAFAFGFSAAFFASSFLWRCLTFFVLLSSLRFLFAASLSLLCHAPGVEPQPEIVPAPRAITGASPLVRPSSRP
jgi:hypothetical protein